MIDFVEHSPSNIIYDVLPLFFSVSNAHFDSFLFRKIIIFICFIMELQGQLFILFTNNSVLLWIPKWLSVGVSWNYLVCPKEVLFSIHFLTSTNIWIPFGLNLWIQSLVSLINCDAPDLTFSHRWYVFRLGNDFHLIISQRHQMLKLWRCMNR